LFDLPLEPALESEVESGEFGALGLSPIVADSLDGTALHGFLTLFALFVVFRLLIHVGITFVFLALEIVWCRLTAEVTVDALTIYVESALHIFGISIFFVCHVL
jgi:hypothetical protein